MENMICSSLRELSYDPMVVVNRVGNAKNPGPRPRLPRPATDLAEVLMVKFLAPVAYLTGMPLGFLGCSSKAQIILNRLTDVIFVGFAVKLFWIENE